MANPFFYYPWWSILANTLPIDFLSVINFRLLLVASSCKNIIMIATHIFKNKFVKKCLDVIIIRFKIRYTNLIRSFLITKKPALTCNKCKENLAINYIIVTKPHSYTHLTKKKHRSNKCISHNTNLNLKLSIIVGIWILHIIYNT